VKHIHKKFEGQQGIWSKYVTNDLIPRLNGFELLMASYAMAHLKMDMLLTETGYKPTDDQRFKIFLTNSLEEPHERQIDLFTLLADEANQANEIKRDTPVMCVIGNPPYAVSSTNKNEWIQNLIAGYKKDLNERKINLDDDYIKFTRFGQHYIDKNGEGILAYISNNSFIDGITHRQMRKHLLESFDKIYILDLHGNAKKKEVCPDGSPDQNVFDIMQGVSINIFVKTGKKQKNQLGEVFNIDLFGKRNLKYAYLLKNNIAKLNWKKINYEKPDYYFIEKDNTGIETYSRGINVTNLFLVYGSGFKTERDAVTIHMNRKDIENVINDFRNDDESSIRTKYNLKKDARDWSVLRAKNDVIKNNNDKLFTKITYRPFDDRYTYFTGTSKGFIGTPGTKVNSLLLRENLALLFKRQCKQVFSYVFIVDKPCESCTFESAFANNLSFPLYNYTNSDNQQTVFETTERVPNLNMEIVNQIATGLGLTFTNEKEETPNTFAPIDLLDYIYAVLHSPTYREKYKEFLKIDFPRVPFPHHSIGTGRDLSVQNDDRDLSVQKIQEKFWQLVKLGGNLRQIHLLESPRVEKYITQYPEDGDNVVTKPKYQDNNVFINDTQYFANVPEIAWNFYIGGYQPAQKWLKDRKDRELSYEDILHYQKIIVALTETDRIMREIDEIEIE
jgi:predicted helicase